MLTERNTQRIRAAQVGFLMRSYREAFLGEDGRRGLTQEELLQRMATTNDVYGVRYSHATVSRWESGHTRPDVHRLRVFGQALDMSPTEVAGLILLAGLAPDFQSASSQVGGAPSGTILLDMDGNEEPMGPDTAEHAPPAQRGALFVDIGSFFAFRFLPLALLVVGLGFALSTMNWETALMPVVYVGMAMGLVLAQGFLLPNQTIPFREFFWVSMFFLLSTPLFEFAPIQMDHYNFYVIGNFAGTSTPYILALLTNLVLAGTAGAMFHFLWQWQYGTSRERKDAFRRAAWVAFAPVVFVFGVVVVVTNLAVTVQMAVLFAAFAAVFASLLLLRDPSLNPGERDQRVLFPTVVAVALVTSAAGLFTILFVYASPDLPSVLPDHNLVASWEIDFDELGYSKEEALQRLNLGYLWHAICLFVYMLFVVGGRLLVAVYRMGEDGTRPSAHTAGQPVSGAGSPGRARRLGPLAFRPVWTISRRPVHQGPGHLTRPQ